MILSLSEIMSVPDKIAEMDIPLECTQVDFQGVRYEFVKKPPVHLKITNQNHKKVLVEGDAEYTLSIPCSRCLESVEVKIPVEIHVSLDFSRDDDERTREMEEEGYLNGYSLDVDLLVVDEILLNFPEKVLCQEDCKGLCRECGQNLNQGECGCNRQSLDPRMAAIQDIFKNFKEV